MRKLQIALLIFLMCGIAIALWLGLHPEPPRPTIVIRLLSVTNSPTATTSAILTVSNTCDQNVSVFGPDIIEYRPPPVVPARILRSAPPVTLAPRQMASFQVSPMPTQTWRTGFSYGYSTSVRYADLRGIMSQLSGAPPVVRAWLSRNGLSVGAPSIAPYHRYSEWIGP
jgi:hypothetical protein